MLNNERKFHKPNLDTYGSPLLCFQIMKYWIVPQILKGERDTDIQTDAHRHIYSSTNRKGAMVVVGGGSVVGASGRWLMGPWLWLYLGCAGAGPPPGEVERGRVSDT